MSAVRWVIDHHPAHRLGLPCDPVADAVRAAGHACVDTVYDPAGGVGGVFPNELAPVFAEAGALVLRGSVGFAAWAHAQWPKIRPGAFRSARLNVAAWLPIYGELALNHGGVIVAYGDFDARRTEWEDRFGGSLFVKPADGGKLLSGTVLAPGQPLFDAHFAAHRRWPTTIPDEYRLLVASVHAIQAEWRFVIAGKAVIAASRYKLGPDLDLDAGAPAGAAALAGAVARHDWQPVDVYVADVAQTGNDFRLLELNTFGTAGLYACDLRAIVDSVSTFAGKAEP